MTGKKGTPPRPGCYALGDHRFNGCGDGEHARLKHPSEHRRKIMSFKTRMLATFALVALTLGLFSSSRSVSAVSDCQKAKGNLSAVNNGSSATGIITQGGKLNGTTQAVHTSGFTPTPDPTTFSFTDDLSVTTNKGVLITHNVVIFDVARGLFSAIARIDPNASTGDFAGATGVLYLNGKTLDGGASVQAEITGDICFAN
jgi:hypothetical protein